MFKFLKDKLNKAVSIFSKKVEEEADEKKDELEKQPEETKEEIREAEKPVQPVTMPDKPVEVKEESETLPEPEILEEQPIPEEPEIAQAPEEKTVLEPETEAVQEPLIEPEPEPEPREHKPTFFERLFKKKEEPKELPHTPEPEPTKQEEILEEKKGVLTKLKETITTIKLSDEKFESLFWDLEMVMLENNVAVEVIEKIKEDLKAELTTGKVSRKGIDELIQDSLKSSVRSLFVGNNLDLLEQIRSKQEKPFIISFIGVNGSGKTTTMAKIAHLLIKNNLSVVFAASDTFRAAAIQQLQEHADRLGVKMIRHDYESDPAAVAFDAIKHAQAKGIDVVLIDTAGRLHTNDNLMNELRKLIRVNKPDLKIFVGEAITGNDCVEQAKLFNDAVGIDAIVLAKADVDEKGGASISVSFVTKKPILYLGTGQGYDDLIKFDPDIVIKNIGL